MSDVMRTVPGGTRWNERPKLSWFNPVRNDLHQLSADFH